MKIQTGHPVTGDANDVDTNRVRFVDDDDRCVFEVSIGDDGASIEIRAVEAHKVDGIVHDSKILIEPMYSNSVMVRTKAY